MALERSLKYSLGLISSSSSFFSFFGLSLFSSALALSFSAFSAAFFSAFCRRFSSF